MFEVNHFSLFYSNRTLPTLSDINFKITEDKAIGILGPNGSGKSSLAYCLGGIIPHLAKGKFEGTILLDGSPIDKMDFNLIVKKVNYLFQDPESQFINLRVRDELLFGLQNLGYPMEESNVRIQEVANLVGISKLLDKETNSLSIGQKQLVVLGSVIAMNPRIIIFDEPTGSLDPKHEKNVLRIINKLIENGTIVIIITHKIDQIKNIANRIILLSKGSIEYDGNVNDIPWSNLNRLYGVEETILRLISSEKQKRIMKISNICYKYSSSHYWALQNLSFEVQKVEILGLMGQNGSGKSTLLLILQNLLKPNIGNIMLENVQLSQIPFKQLINKIGIAFQNPNHQIINLSIKEELEFGLKNANVPSDIRKDRINEMLNRFPYLNSNQTPQSLSFGQKKMLTIASILVMDPSILLLDEPDWGLDAGHISVLKNIIIDLSNKGKTIVISSQNVELMDEIADRIIFLKNGELKFIGEKKEVINQIRREFDD